MEPSPPDAGGSAVVVFDGVCNLCNASVDFLLAHDRQGRLRFASLQSAAGRTLLERHGFPAPDADTFAFVERGRVHVRSDGVVAVMRHLPPPWRWAAALAWIPRPLRDWAYRLIARNRYRWFGRREACRVPGAGEKDRFME